LFEAKETKGDMIVVCLDLANAYGTVPHKLMETSLEPYLVSERIRG
jgi:hypothetical protein